MSIELILSPVDPAPPPADQKLEQPLNLVIGHIWQVQIFSAIGELGHCLERKMVFELSFHQLAHALALPHVVILPSPFLRPHSTTLANAHQRSRDAKSKGLAQLFARHQTE
ncbi:predicted protein [Histoplasma mississippiense (nom. inval.)]|uniref:predicted protein n=1 Tax=Ajellomyces capsulatus (strain NAm1 / WU24) TaxID=2059318 RepID=UPI000157C1C4|nr:predicted protein [Histoplasma mississippiense (nom. inval.)]EDN07363.1 predicted protein [Histoplasma mississippiense (nom. inval.)]